MACMLGTCTAKSFTYCSLVYGVLVPVTKIGTPLEGTNFDVYFLNSMLDNLPMFFVCWFILWLTALIFKPEQAIEGRSYFTIGAGELQTLVDNLSGTGYPKFRGTSFREIVDTGKTIGVILYLDGKTPTPTTWISIHYSKTGVHVVPEKAQ